MRCWTFIFLLALALPATAQNSGDQNLPAAPSAVRTEQQKPPQSPPTPPPAPVEAKPAEKPAEKPAQANPAPASNFTGTSPPPSTSSNASDVQSGGAELPSPETIIRRVVDEVAVVFTVTDKRGRFVKDLKQDDFRFLDDKRPVKSISAFRTETDLPLRVGLLIDASTSIRDRFKFEQEAAVEFLSQIVRYKKDAAFVLGFDSVYEVVQDFSDDNEKLSKGIRKLRPGGGTAMYDALFYSCRDKLMKRSDPFATRRAVILLSDGEDTQSRVTMSEAIGICQRAETVVYAISTNVSGVKKPADKELLRIAEETGGRAFFPFKIDDVANAFLDIQEELRSQYAVAYKPDAFIADGRFRAIEIKPRAGRLEVRARRGYYAPTK